MALAWMDRLFFFSLLKLHWSWSRLAHACGGKLLLLVLVPFLFFFLAGSSGARGWALVAFFRRALVFGSRVDDDRSMKRNSRGTRRGSTARARTLRQGKEKNGMRIAKCPFLSTRAREEQEEGEALVHPHAPRERAPPQERERTAHVRLFYNPRMQISGSQKPGGRSHAHPLVGRKGGRVPPWIQTFAYAVQPFP